MTDLAGLRVLVADDEMHIRKIINAVCIGIGIRDVVEAADGRSALEALRLKKVESGRRKSFDLIICDWMMPEMNGLELLKRVKADAVLKDMPFLMVTAEGERQNVLAAVESGASDYIVKPFTAEILEHKIRAVLKKSQK